MRSDVFHCDIPAALGVRRFPNLAIRVSALRHPPIAEVFQLVRPQTVEFSGLTFSIALHRLHLHHGRLKLPIHKLMQIGIQPAQQSHIPLLVEFMRQFYEIDHYPFDEPVARTALVELLADDSLGRVWLIAEGEMAVGYIVLTFSYSLEYGGRNAFIDELYLDANHRGKGIGTQVVKFVAENCPELGIKALHLEVEPSNLRGQSLYKKSGFKLHDRRLMTKRFYGFGIHPET